MSFYRATIAGYGVDPLALPRLSRGARDPRQHVRKLAPGFVFLRMKRGREARQLKDEKTATDAGEEREQRAKSEGSVSRDKRLARQLRALGCSITPAAAAAGALVLAMLLLSLSRLPPSCLLPRDSTHDARISLSLSLSRHTLSQSLSPHARHLSCSHTWPLLLLHRLRHPASCSVSASPLSLMRAPLAPSLAFHSIFWLIDGLLSAAASRALVPEKAREREGGRDTSCERQRNTREAK